MLKALATGALATLTMDDRMRLSKKSSALAEPLVRGPEGTQLAGATLLRSGRCLKPCKPFNIQNTTGIQVCTQQLSIAFSRCSSLLVSPCISSCTTKALTAPHLRMTTQWHLLEGKNNLNLTCTMPGQEMQACMHGHTSFLRCTSQYAFDDRPGIGLAADASVQHDTVYSRQSQGESSCWLQPQHD